MRPEEYVHGGPWTSGELVGLWVRIAVGLVLIVAAWAGISGELLPSRQLRWIDLAVLGLVVVALSNVIWLLSGMRQVRQVQRRLILHLEDATNSTHHGLQTLELQDMVLVAGKGMTKYHHPDCPMVAGKVVRPASAVTHKRRGLVPCGLCQP